MQTVQAGVSPVIVDSSGPATWHTAEIAGAMAVNRGHMSFSLFRRSRAGVANTVSDAVLPTRRARYCGDR